MNIKIGIIVIIRIEGIMSELEIILNQFLELSKNNPDSLFKIRPNETGQWIVGFTKGGYWWEWMEEDNEGLSPVVKSVLDNFDKITDKTINNKKIKDKENDE